MTRLALIRSLGKMTPLRRKEWIQSEGISKRRPDPLIVGYLRLWAMIRWNCQGREELCQRLKVLMMADNVSATKCHTNMVDRQKTNSPI